MTDCNLEELMQLAKSDKELFERKRIEIIASFIDSFSSSPAIQRLVRIQKTIDQRVNFNVINNDPILFEEKRQEMISSFFNSFSSGSNKDTLISLQNTIENKMKLYEQKNYDSNN